MRRPVFTIIVVGMGAACAQGLTVAQDKPLDGPVPEEICDNHKDDDHDARIDCSDPDCEDYTCVEFPPGGWSGPALLQVGDALPDCPESYVTAVDGGVGELAPPEYCTPCECEGTLPDCSSAVIEYYSEANCTGTATPITMQYGQCHVVPLPTGFALSARAELPTSSQTCIPSGGLPVFDHAPPNLEDARVCTDASTGSCQAENTICAPKPDPAFGTKLCVYIEHDIPCPENSSYTERTLVQRGAAAFTGCTACECGPLAGFSCFANTFMYENGACEDGIGAVHHNGACTDFFQYAKPVHGSSFTISPFPGYCQASGGEPTDFVPGDEPLTVCCTEEDG